jgi:uncharacterized protein
MATPHASHLPFWRLVSKRLMSVRFVGAAALSASLLMGCAALDTRQGQWIFNPSDRSWGDSATVASSMQDVWIDYPSQITNQPVKLHALVHPAQRADAPVLLFLHGARWSVAGSAYRIQRMQELGFTVVAVDYRGFGKTSQEVPHEKMAYEDAKAAWQWMATAYPNKPRYIFGHSLGGAIAIELASTVQDEAGTIVEGTFTSIPDVASTMRWGWLPVGGFITQRFESIKKVATIGSPLLVVHGSNDTLIKPALGRQLFDAAAQPKRFVLVEGGSHHSTNAVGQAAYQVALTEMFGIKSLRQAVASN